MARSFSRFGRMPEGPTSRVDLAELVSSLAVQHGTAAFAIETYGERGVMVDGHFDSLERAFRNLVVNAIEAQEGRGGRLDISLGREDGFAVVRMEDQGPGVPPELLHDIWSPDVTTKSHGTGLGLAIVRQTVAHHGGTVDVRNRLEGGAAFTVRLPLAELSPDRAPWTS
jgi:signal transduction histidine kinase